MSRRGAAASAAVTVVRSVSVPRSATVASLRGWSSVIALLGVLAVALTTLTGCGSGDYESAATAAPTGGGGLSFGVASIATITDRTGAGMRRESAAIKSTGASWVRVFMNWNETEPEPGLYQWDRLDDAVDAARGHDLSILGLIAGPAPAWAGRAPHNGSSAPLDSADFADFAKRVASRYSSSVSTWELWNEPNLPGYWAAPRASDYAETLTAGYAAIKSVQPHSTVISGGVSPDISGVPILTFLQGLYDAGAGDSFDAVGLHPYTVPYPLATDPFGRSRVISDVRDLMARNGQASKKIWVTEWGQPTGDNKYAVDEPRQAEILTSGLRFMTSQPNMGPVFVFTSKDWSSDRTNVEFNYGLFRYDYSPKPIVARLRELAR